MFHSLWCLGAQRKGMVIYMIRGVHFKIPQKMDNIIFNILCCLNVESYYWFKISSQTEVWGEQIEEDFFEKEFYKGDEFLNIIKNKHRIIFLKIQGYLKECDIKNMSLHQYCFFGERKHLGTRVVDILPMTMIQELKWMCFEGVVLQQLDLLLL